MEQEQEIINNTKAEILENLKDKLEEISKGEEQEIDFHDIVTNSVDSNTPQDTLEAIKFAEYTGNEHYADEGILDKSSINRFAVTMAYECLNQEVFNDDFIQELEDKLNNENVGYKKAQEIIKEIESELSKYGEVEHKDTETQIYINKTFDLSKDDFKQPYFSKGQILDLSDNSIKIFTNNKEVNKNAIVLENVNKNPFRVYLMGKDKDLDVRNLFSKKEYNNKKEFISVINLMANNLVEKSIKG